MIAPKKGPGNVAEDTISSSPMAIPRDHGSSSDSDDERPATLETFMTTLTATSVPPTPIGTIPITSTPARLPFDGTETTVMSPKLVTLPSKSKKDEKKAHPSHESSSLGHMAPKQNSRPLEPAQVASTEKPDVALAPVKEHGSTIKERMKHRLEAKKTETSPAPSTSSEVVQPQPESLSSHAAAQVNTNSCDLAPRGNTVNQVSAKISHHDFSVSQFMTRSPGAASEVGKQSQPDQLILSTFEDTSKKILISRLKRLTAEEVALKDWEFVAKAAKTTASSSLPFSIMSNPIHKQMVLEKFENISEEFKGLWTFLQKRLVEPLEKAFENEICFSDADFETTAKNHERAAFQDYRPKTALADMEQLLKDKVKQFIDEYRRQNKKVQGLEREAVQVALKLCADYYRNEMEFLLGNTYSEEIELHHADVSKDAMEIFAEACQLKSSHWSKFYDSHLRTTLDDLKMTLCSSNKLRKLELEKQLGDLVDEAKKLYHTKVDDRCLVVQQGQSEVSLVGAFEKIEDQARSDAEVWFNNQTATFSRQIVAPSIERLKHVLNSQYNLKRQELLKQEAEERRRQFEEEQKKKREAANATAAAAAKKKLAQVYTIDGVRVTGNQHHTSTVNQQNDISRPDEISWGHLIQLTKTTVAFHLGLHRTKMGIVNKHGVIQVLANVDNCLYFEASKFVTTNADTAKKLKLGKETSLHDLLVKNELGKLYEVRIKGVMHQFRLEELISFILATLKWETEFEQWWHIHNCLIVVPQSLNDNQRQAVKDAAELAGFLHTTLINDTSAMALSYVMDQGVRDSQFITVNTCERFIDAASFTVSYLDGSINRDKVTGDTFVDVGSRGFLEAAAHFVGFGSTDFSRRAKAIFNHGEFATTRKITAILSSLGDEAKALAGLMSNVANDVVKVDTNYALMGAGYLIAIASLDPDHRIYQKFAQSRGPTEKTVQSFRDKLLRKNPDPVKKSASSSTALPLSANQMEFQEKKTKYYLRTTRALHTEKMRWLQLVHNVHHQLGDPCCHLDQIRRQEIMDQLQAQRSEFKHLKASSAGQETVLKAQMGVYSLLKQL